MKKWGCLLSWVIFILFVSGVYAFNGLLSDDIKSPDYYAVNVRAMFNSTGNIIIITRITTTPVITSSWLAVTTRRM